MVKHSRRERRRRVPRDAHGRVLGPLIRPASPVSRPEPPPSTGVAFRRFTPDDIKRARENAELARQVQDPDADEGLHRLLAGLADEPASEEEVAARMARFREGLAKLDTDPAERARIERIAREADVITDDS